MELAHKNKLIKQFRTNLAGKPMIVFCCKKILGTIVGIILSSAPIPILWFKFFATEFQKKSHSHEQGNLDFWGKKLL
jgi:hypothetical protein